ncbi:hypothetical protein BDV25DRAFT_160110 [Aspergillus avenaceus]|uniref:Uncharacterized protein n=1 Tax=Aspergillus avenaceus TaxID=36643 RepID=A0A5N6TML3_ASPAV|nr:hypothetical protein BDV25DRAFT_160110 [Aspergillus avenaceus]
MFRLRRAFPNSRLSFHIGPPAPHASNITNVRYVKFKRPWIRRLLATCLLYGTAFHLWSSFVLLQFDDTLDEAENTQQTPLEKKSDRSAPGDEGPSMSTDENVDTDPIFIPLGWPRLRKGAFYAASDPEWQGFLKISRDREKLQNLRDELAAIVQKDASQSKLLSRVLGGPLTVTGFWLVHRFPYRAPPEYGRSGLEVTDTGLSWVSKPMSLEDGDRLRRCMWPLFVALATKDAYTVLIKRQLSRFKTSFPGQELATDSTDVPSHKSPPSGLQSLDGLSHVSQHEAGVATSHIPKQDTTETNGNSHLHPSPLLSTLQRLPLPHLGPGSDLHVASLAFRWRLHDCWAREPQPPRRGAFYFAGPVGLRGPKGFCRVEVRGEYDPGSESWSLVSIQLKDVNIFNQKALGGS